ncbi:hypothetical protein CFC21_105478, partial [Triticum aestivum]
MDAVPVLFAVLAAVAAPQAADHRLRLLRLAGQRRAEAAKWRQVQVEAAGGGREGVQVPPAQLRRRRQRRWRPRSRGYVLPVPELQLAPASLVDARPEPSPSP